MDLIGRALAQHPLPYRRDRVAADLPRPHRGVAFDQEWFQRPEQQPRRIFDARRDVFIRSAHDLAQFFKDEGGDIFSESRSTTPVSFMSGGKEALASRSGTPGSSRDISPAPQRPESIARKEFDQSHVPAQFRRSQPPTSDPYDDRANLLAHTGDMRATNGEFMPHDQYQAYAQRPYRDNSGTNTPADELNSGYDYFHGRR